jgi:hypothetical protein
MWSVYLDGRCFVNYASTVNTIRSIILCSLSGTDGPSSKASFVNWYYVVEIEISVADIGAGMAKLQLYISSLKTSI